MSLSVVPLTMGTQGAHHPGEDVWVQVLSLLPLHQLSLSVQSWVGWLSHRTSSNIQFPGSVTFPSISSQDPRLLISKTRRVGSKSVSFFLRR